MKIFSRILTGFLAGTVLLLATTIIAIANMNIINSEYRHAIEKHAKPLGTIGHLLESVHAIRAELRMYVAYYGVTARDPVPDFQAQENKLRFWMTNFEEQSSEFEKNIENETAKEKFKEAMNTYNRTFKPSAENIIENAKNGMSVENLIIQISEKTSPAMDIIADDLAFCMNTKISNLDNISASAAQKEKAGMIALIAITLAAAAISAVLSILVARSISKPITELSKFMKTASDGNFSERLPSKYEAEIGQLFNACNALVIYNDMNVTNLRDTAAKMRISAMELLSISSGMIENSNTLNEQTSSVSAATQELAASMSMSSESLATASQSISSTASSIEEMNTTIKSIATTAEETCVKVEETSVLTDDIQESIAASSESVDDIAKTFNKIAMSVSEINSHILKTIADCDGAVRKMSIADEKVNNTNIIIQKLEESSKQIGKITGIVKDIADQTNMLAINAAIEAAGAGEAGKGFMVVANEVKELSKQTAEATAEIVGQIEHMQKSMTGAVMSVSEITAFIKNMNEFIGTLTEKVKQSGTHCESITANSSEAAIKISGINAEINKISENAVSVNETAAVSAKNSRGIAEATAELVNGSKNITSNSENASSNIEVICTVMNEMVKGVESVANNTQSINQEAYMVQLIAGSVKKASEELLETANVMEELISEYKIS